MINILNIQTFIKLFLLNLFKPTKKEKEKFFISSCSILFTVSILIFVNLLIYLFYPDNSEVLRIEAEKIISPLYHRRIAPEPIEQLQFLTSLILIPLLIISSIKIFSSKLFSRLSVADFIYFFNFALCFSLLGILFYFSFNIDDPNIESIPLNVDHPNSGHQGIRRYFSRITSNLMFTVAIIIYPLVTYFIIKGIPKKYDKFVNILLYSFISIILISLFLLSIFNRDNYIGADVHLNSVLYPISQVQQGKTLLVDLTSLYGLYPEFLYPIFKLINVNIISFSITMAALTSISYLLILLGLRKIIRNNLVTFLAFIAIIYFGYIAFFIAPSPINNMSFDIYHAYKPIRIIFPALILYSVFTYILTPKRNLYLLITFISSLSILWNFDSGVICFLSFYIYILYERLIGNNVRDFTKDFIKHTFISFGILALTILLFSSYIYFRSYNFPDWSLFLELTNIFASAYYFSLPMQLFNAWNLIFLIYLYGIYIGFNSILSGKKDPIDKTAFFIAIFGLGISTYYINRSHDFNLLQTLYPSLILLAIFLDKLLAKNNRADLFQIKNLSIVMLISFVLVVTLFQTLQPNKMINALSNRIPDIINNKLTNQLASDGIALVNFNASPNDKAVIISDIDTKIHLETKTASPFFSPGSSSNVTKKDWDILMNSLINNKSYKVFISGNVYRFGKTPDSRLIEILKIFDEYYYLDDWLGDWRMFIPKRYKPVNVPKLNALASYSEFCPNNLVGCNNIVKNLNIIENFSTKNKLIKIDFNLSAPITLQNIILHVIIDGNYSGTLTTSPIQELGNIGILDNEHKKFINTDERLNKLDYKVEQKFSVLVPENNYMATCTVFKVELIYNNNDKVNVHVPCKSEGKLPL